MKTVDRQVIQAVLFSLLFVLGSINAISQDRVWSTYYGSTSNDYILSTTSDEFGNIYIAGYTASSSGLARNSRHLSTLQGGEDGFIAKFSKDGYPLWFNYFGGSDDDRINVIKYHKGLLYIGGTTKSSNGISTSDVHQSTRGGNLDGFISCFDSSGRRLWGTYYGGSGHDDISDLDITSGGEIAVTGSAFSSDKIASSGAHQTRPASTALEACIALFAADGKLKWGTYFGGDEEDASYRLCVDFEDNIIVQGRTVSDTGIAVKSAYKSKRSGDYDAFIVKFDTNGKRIWSTYYGGASTDYGYGIDTDEKGNIYIAGMSRSDTGIAKGNKWKSSLSGSYDVYIAKLNAHGSVLWGTYYGGSGYDFANSLRFYKGKLLIAGFTQSNSGIAYPTGSGGSLQSSLDGMILELDTTGYPKFGSYLGGNLDDRLYCAEYTPYGSIIYSGETFSNLKIATSGAYLASKKGLMEGWIGEFGLPRSITDLTTCGPYKWSQSNTEYTGSGFYIDTIIRPNNTDSLVILNLFIAPVNRDTTVIEACYSYNWRGADYTSDGLYQRTLTNRWGCDSILFLDLTINDSIVQTIRERACDAFHWDMNDSIFTQSGIYRASTSRSNGCDSIVYLELDLSYSTHTDLQIEACNEYRWPLSGKRYTTSTKDSVILRTSSGCDSVVYLWLEVNQFETEITLSDGVLNSIYEADVYIWYNCDLGIEVEGEGKKSFKPKSSGSYALISYDQFCRDTSACLYVDVVSVQNKVRHSDGFQVRPNPCNGRIVIEGKLPWDEYRILDVSGRIMRQESSGNTSSAVDLKVSPGVYVLEIFSEGGHKQTFRIQVI